MTDHPLADQTALITGGGRGIGRAIALAFAEAGANVCVLARSTGEIDIVAGEIQQRGGNALAVTCDVTRHDDVEAAVTATTKHFGPVTLLVNNAGGGQERTPVGDDDPQKWRSVIEVNLLGTYHCSRAVLPVMKAAGGGTIINVGSGMGHQARANNSSYNAAKAAVTMFTKCLALEVWRDNIAVNELIPGPVYTELTQDIFTPDASHPAIESEWVKQPEDVVPLALFLATQPQRGPTGQTFSIARRPI